MGERGVTHGLKFQARALAAQIGDKTKPRWLVGTTALREENEIQLLEYDAEDEVIRVVEVIPHAPEIWSISPSPSDAGQFVTVYNSGGVYGAALWGRDAKGRAAKRSELKGLSEAVRRVLWHPQQPDQLVSIEEGRLRRWAIRDEADMTADTSAGDIPQLWTGAWDPRDPNQLLTAGGNSIQVWDLRSMRRVGGVEAAHGMPVRDLDLDPHRPNQLVSAGDDCRLRFWDLRGGSGGSLLLELGGHSHWVWQARYSPTHRGLLLSASSDGLVRLWLTPALAQQSEAAAQAGQASRFRDAAADRKAFTFDDHEESVYGIAWSAADPWVFASLSYDGRVVVNRVPSAIKYKILL